MVFWSNLDTPLDFFAFFLVLAVVFVNGFTDAPNSVHSSVKAGALTLQRASVLCGIFNFFGVFLSSFLFFSVGKSVWELASVKGSGGGAVACACLITVVAVGVLAWVLKMPSSESHALLFSLTGARLCLSGEKENILLSTLYIVFSIVFSSLLAYFSSLLLTKHASPRIKIRPVFLSFSLCALSFMHGAQDGQKLLAILLVVAGVSVGGSTPPLILVLSVGVIMCLSSMLSGKRILASMDDLSTNTDTSRAFFADLAAFASLIVCSACGLPVSTGNIKSASVYATETSSNKKSKKVIIKIFATSVITLPISFLFGFIICKLLLLVN